MRWPVVWEGTSVRVNDPGCRGLPARVVIALAERARDAFREAGAPASKELAEVEAFLRERPLAR